MATRCGRQAPQMLAGNSLQTVSHRATAYRETPPILPARQECAAVPKLPDRLDEVRPFEPLTPVVEMRSPWASILGGAPELGVELLPVRAQPWEPPERRILLSQ